MEKTYNVCENRGSKRVWIEGKVLLDMQTKRGIKFSRTMNGESMVLVIGDENGKHTVAGTPERPIIDLNGKYLNEFFGNAPKYTAVFSPKSIPSMLFLGNHKIGNEHATITITPSHGESAK